MTNLRVREVTLQSLAEFTHEIVKGLPGGDVDDHVVPVSGAEVLLLADERDVAHDAAGSVRIRDEIGKHRAGSRLVEPG